MNKSFLLVGVIAILSCFNLASQNESVSFISEETVESVKAMLLNEHGMDHDFRIERGVNSVATHWRSSDGCENDFEEFCKVNFIADDNELDLLFDRIANNFEFLYGYLGRISVELNRQIHEDRGDVHKIDQIFASYSPSAHLQEDLFRNRIAFIIGLNFPEYSLEEKNRLGGEWCYREWGYARLGDYFGARITADILQQNAEVSSRANLYISEYNIYAGYLLNDEDERLFPSHMRLLSHWNIRDEIKSNYDDQRGLEKQEILYKVMLRIINQDIPKEFINSRDYLWNPFSNNLYDEEKVLVDGTPEYKRRYELLLENFHSMQRVDPYYAELDTYFERSFESQMEISYEEVSSLFKEYASSPLLRDVAEHISDRLGRSLRPFDLWYNGFAGRGGIPESELDKITKSRYPNAAALEEDLTRQLLDLGFESEQAKFISSKIEVNAARGSGHAMRASMRSKPSHLRTRIGEDGMDYKGYNIAIHEFGHNVEQTISNHYVDNYFLSGIPNTAFTEALAFMFQKRDLQLLGVEQSDDLVEHTDVLDMFWDNYEMMGVSLLDMEVWRWLYENPDATAVELKEAVLKLSKSIWNSYYADIFGEKDVPVLAIYSHMIQSPLYLMNYPYGRLIMFQLEDYIVDKDFACEVVRMFSQGYLTPHHWMKGAVGEQISNQPLFDAVEEALEAIAK
ncbi:hypothetical protein QA597_09505 [Marinilabiliaceae bacterium ANBcel2]|nr:hypothetical protein [Marinilabiliaceae bacterium ANBcel2]